MTERRYQKGVAAPADVPPSAVQAFHVRTRRSGEHLLWTGATDNSSTPVLTHSNTIYPVLRVAWALHYAREALGVVRSSCEVRLCVAGPCLTDAVSRQREHLLRAAVLGVDMSGTCVVGHRWVEHGSVRLTGKVDCRPCASRRHRDQRALEKAVA